MEDIQDSHYRFARTRSSMMFDYNLFGKGYVYSDIRNVNWAKTVRGYKNMSLNKIFDTTTIVFGAIAVILFILLWVKDPTVAKSSAQSGLVLFLRYSVLIIFPC